MLGIFLLGVLDSGGLLGSRMGSRAGQGRGPPVRSVARLRNDELADGSYSGIFRRIYCRPAVEFHLNFV